MRCWVSKALEAERRSPSEEAAFDAYALHVTMRLGQIWPLLVAAVTLLWWPLDAVVFDRVPVVSGGDLVAVRVVTLVIDLVVFAALRWLPAAQRHARVVVPAYQTVAVACLGFTLARFGGPNTPWLGFAYIAILPTALLPLRLGPRVLAAVAPTVGLELAYFGTQPEYLRDPFAPATLSFLTVAALSAVAAGHALHFFHRRAFFQSLALERTTQELRDLNTTLETRVREQTADIRRLAIHQEATREDERARIARDLHDVLGQEITAARYALEFARRRYACEPESVGPLLDELDRLLARTSTTARETIAELRPRVLDDLGLVPALEWLTERFGKATGLDVELRAVEGAVHPTVAVPAFRIVQEALTNAARHANASHVLVEVTLDDAAITVEVRDDGAGIAADAKQGMGLFGMRERARALGGGCEVRALSGGGTLVSAYLPQPTAPERVEEGAAS